MECVKTFRYLTRTNVTIISSVSELFAWFTSCEFIDDKSVKTSTSLRTRVASPWADCRRRNKWRWSASFDCPSISFTQLQLYQTAGSGVASSLTTRLDWLEPLLVASDSTSILPRKDSPKISEDDVFLPLVKCLELAPVVLLRVFGRLLAFFFIYKNVSE